MTQMFKISLPDGSVREVAAGSTPADIAAAIGPGLAKAAIAARDNPSTRLKQNIAQFDMGGTSLPSGATVINAQPEGMATGKVGKKH